MQKQSKTVGLLGAGYILGYHANALLHIPTASLFAVCDISKARAEAAAAQYGIPNVFTSLDDLLYSPVECIHVLLPPYLHEEVAEKAILSGKHVLLEKPMGLGADRCARLVELAKEKGTKLGVSHNFLFSPAYATLRNAIKGGELGVVDHVTINWISPLGSIQLGPYNNWMFHSPENLFFELAPHALAFALDILGPMDEVTAKASDPVDLPGHQRVYRQWTMTGIRGKATCVVNISVNPGQEDRSLYVRGSAAIGRLDYGRGIGWIEKTDTNSALIDLLSYGRSVGRTVRRMSRINFLKYLRGSLLKSADSNPYSESIYRSIACFYSTLDHGLDRCLDGGFGVEVIRTCERATVSSNVVKAAGGASSVMPPAREPDTLVIGGTGFIGKRLVFLLVAEGRSLRVLTRSRESAIQELEGLPVDIVEGAYGNVAVLDRALQGIRTVYHLAKAAGTKWSDYLEADVEPTERLAQACLRHGVDRFVYTGTIDSYSSSSPFSVITGGTPLDPRIQYRNLYARSKATCEAILVRMHREQGLPLVILRPGIVIGKGSPPAHWGVGKFLTDTFVQYWGKGDNPLPFVLVDDVARALSLAGSRAGIEGKMFLLTDAPLLTAREYVELVERFSGNRIRQLQVPIWKYFLVDCAKEAIKHAIRHPNRRAPSYHDWACRAHRSVYDSKSSMESLGWKPSGDKACLIDQGIKAAVEYYYR